MNYCDWGFVGVILVCSLCGWLGGLFSALSTMLAWGGALWLAFLSAPKAVEILQGFNMESDLVVLVSVLGGFAAWLILVLLLMHLLLLLVHRFPGKRLLGGLLCGMLNGLWVSLVVVFLVGFTVLPEVSIWRESHVQKFLTRPAGWFWRVLPNASSEVRDAWSPPPADSWEP